MRSPRPSLVASCAMMLAIATAALPEILRGLPQRPAPAPIERGDIELMLHAAAELAGRQKFLEARQFYERAFEPARQLGLARHEADARGGLAEVLVELAQYAPAREQGELSVALYERLGVQQGVGRVRLAVGVAQEWLGAGEDARRSAEQAIAAFETIGNRRGVAMAKLLLARLTPDPQGDFRLVQEAFEDAKSAGDVKLQGAALHSWGDGLFARGRYEPALATLEQAAEMYRAVSVPRSLGTVYNSLGRLYRAHGRLDVALDFQLQALALHEQTNAAFETVQSLNAVAVVYQMLDHRRMAQKYFERALVLAEKTSSPRIQDFLRANIALQLLAQGEFARSAAALEQVLANGLDSYPSVRNANLAFAYLLLNRLDDALAAAERALASCGEDATACINALSRRAAVQVARRNPDAALADVRSALDRIESQRARLVPTDFLKQNFHHHREDVYAQAIAILFDQQRDREALDTAELARSRAFLDLLAGRVKESRDDAGRDGATPSPPAASKAAGPSTSSLKSESFVAPAKSEDVVAIARRLQSTVVLYWVAEDALYTWVVTPSGGVTTHRTRAIRSKLADLVRATTPFTGASADDSKPATRAVVTRGDEEISLGTMDETPWRELYDILIRPIRSLLPKAPGSLVTIVPHGPLAGLSFAALQDERRRYLIQDYTLHYVPAGGVLQFTGTRPHGAGRTGDVLVVADPLLPPPSRLDVRLPRLPGARGEARAIGRLLPQARLTVLEDRAATESDLRSTLGSKAVLHFATHAIVRDADPMSSYLALGRTGAEAASDGALSTSEVYDLDLAADLVVLSACRSGAGRLTGDGIATFARAFMYAGTPSIVLSLWDVADEPTNRLLPAFYQSWFGGASKARALRTAQLRLLRDLQAGTVRVTTPAGSVTLPEHPVFWAGFVLVGEPD